MSLIRKKSLKATFWVYFGFLIGALNTYFLTHKSWFSVEENGLTRAMIETSLLIYGFSTLGTTSFLYKFFPYYQDNVEPKKNDMLALALLLALIGFILTCSGLYLMEPIIIRKFSTNSRLFVEYFYWIFPMAFFVLLYNILEAYSYGFEKGVYTSMLKEAALRFYTCVIILLKIFNLIDFKTFVILFALQYAFIASWLIIHLAREKKLWLSFRISRVTLKFRKKIFALVSLTFIVIIVSVLRQSIDGIVLAAKQNLGKVGIFGLAAYMVSVLQAPFRSIVSITVPVLSRAWKDKNMSEIERIYKRSSINLLTFSLFVFFLIWLNFSNGLMLFNINAAYLEGKWVFFLLGIVTIIELGTGVNGQIIGTSVFWRFELWTSLLLTAMIIPLSYYLTTAYGILGPAIANLVSFSVYNAIRYFFLLNKFGLQPFSSKTAEVIIIAIFSYFIAYSIFGNSTGFIGLILGSLLYCLLFIIGIRWRRITPDLEPIVHNTLKRLGIKKA